MKVLASMTKRTPSGFSSKRISIKPEGHRKIRVLGNSRGFPKGAPKNLIKLSRKKIKDIKSLRKMFDSKKKSIEGFGKQRALISKKEIGIDDMEGMGFKGTWFSVPERGQSTQKSYRGPLGLHAHDHGDNWVFHEDSNPPVGFLETLRHIRHEGVPGVLEYGKSIKSKKDISKILNKRR